MKKLVYIFIILFLFTSYGFCQRDLTLKQLQNVVRSAGMECSEPHSLFFQGNVTNTKDELWNITCSSTPYQILVKADGQTRVLPCSILETLNLFCYERY